MKDAMIKIVTAQTDGARRDEAEIITAGQYERTASGWRFSYEETDATGFEGSVTTFRIGEENGCRMEMIRSGKYACELYIERDRKSYSVYSTPMGDMTVGVQAKELSPDLDEDGGTVNVSYVLDINSTFIGDFEMFITVNAKDSSGNFPAHFPKKKSPSAGAGLLS